MVSLYSFVVLLLHFMILFFFFLNRSFAGLDPSCDPAGDLEDWKRGVYFQPMSIWSVFERFMLQFDNNPYGLPGLFYLLPLSLMVFGVCMNIYTVSNAVRPYLGYKDDGLAPLYAELSRLASNLVSLMFFFFPPLWGVRIVEAMLDMVEVDEGDDSR